MRKAIKGWRNNLLLKIISVVIAIVIWYVVVDANDPVIESSFSVRVSVTNDSYIANGKQSYRIDDNYKTVAVYLKGNRSKLKNITADDITVTADLTQIVDFERDPVMVPLQASCPGFNVTDITLSRTTIPIVIENIASKEFPVTVSTGDSKPGSDYEVGVLKPDPEQVIISGPESIVNDIESVVAQIDVTGITRDAEKEASLVLYDKNGDEISQEVIADDLKFDGGVPNITVFVDLWKKQSGVEFEVNYSGEPMDGYHVTAVSTTPDSVTVVGTDEALKELRENGNVLSIPAELISVEGASTDITQEIEIAEFLPDDMRLGESIADTMTVYLNVLSDESREFTLDVDSIELQNMAPGLAVSYDQTEVMVRVSGMYSTVEAMTVDDIKASMDLSGLGIGDYTLPVQLILPDGVMKLGEIELSVHLVELVEKTENTENT